MAKDKPPKKYVKVSAKTMREPGKLFEACSCNRGAIASTKMHVPISTTLEDEP